MTEQTNRLRNSLTTSTEDFDDIVLGRKLGANSNIISIIHMLKDIATQVRSGQMTESAGSMYAKELADYFDVLRGDSTIAVRNAIRRLIHPVEKRGEKTDSSLADVLEKSCEQYLAESAGWNVKLLEAAKNRLASVSAVLVYDYSSSVNSVLSMLAEQNRKIQIYVPESRTLNGGIPFVRNHRDSSLQFHLIPDCAMAYYLPRCDAALIGAETFCRDGGLYNTTGSLTVGILCREFKVPLYAVAQFIKMDSSMEEKRNNLKALEEFDMQKVLGIYASEEGTNLDVKCVGIEHVPARYVTGYFTEEGYVETKRISSYAKED